MSERTWVVSGHLGRFRQGQILTEDADIVEYMRLMFQEGNDEACILTHQQVLQVFDNHLEFAMQETSDDDRDVVMCTGMEEFEAEFLKPPAEDSAA